MPQVTLAGVAKAVGTAIVGTIISVSLSKLASKLLPKPKLPTFDAGVAGRQELTRTIRQAAAPARVVYGEQRIGGVYTYMESTNSNEFHHLIVYLCEGEIDSIGTVYFDDKPIHVEDIDPDSGLVTSGMFSGKARIKKHLGTADQIADEHLVADVPDITNTFVGTNRAYLYVRVEDDRDLFPRIIPDNITANVKGRKVYNPELGYSHWTNNPALCLRDYLTNTRFGAKVPEGRIEDSFVIDSKDVCDEFVTTIEVAAVVTAFDPDNNWVSFAEEILPFQTGDKVKLTTTGTLPDGLFALPDVYYVQVVNEMRGRNKDNELTTATRIRLADSYANALNIYTPDDSVEPDSQFVPPITYREFTSAGTGVATVTKVSEPRYTCNGAFSTDQRIVDVIRDLRSSMGGRAVKAGGVWRIYAASWREPVFDLTDDDIRDITVQTRHSLRDRFSAIKGTYRSPLLFGQLSDYPALTNSTYDAEDGQRVFADLPLPFTSRSQTAQRLANIELRRHRQEITVTLKTTLTALRVQAGNNITLTLDRYGWAAKEFEVDEYGLQIEPDENDNPIVHINLTLRETAQANFDFDYASEELRVDPAPNTNLATIFSVSPPSDVSFESGNAALTRQADGTILAGLLVSWTNTAADRLNDRYEIQYKLSTDTNYRVVIVPASVTEHLITPLVELAIYDVRIRGVNVAGRTSEFITTQIEILGKTEAPPDVDVFTVAREADGTRRFAWLLNNPPLDLAGYQIRYRVGTSMGDFDTATKLTEGLLISSPYETNELGAGQYTFGIVAVDTSGNRSDNPKVITATLGDPRLRNALYSQIESAFSWPGTKTDCFVAPENILEPVGTTGSTWNDFSGTAWEDLAGQSWLDAIPRVSNITYETAVIDLGADLHTTPQVNVTAQGTATVKMRTHTSAEGADVSGETYIALAQIEGERYVQFEIAVSGGAEPPLIYEITSILDGERAVQDYEDINMATESGSFFNSIATGHFQINIGDSGIAVISHAQITALQNVGSGYSWELINKSSTVDSKPAAEFKVYNSSGTLTDATVDVTLKGPKGTS